MAFFKNSYNPFKKKAYQISFTRLLLIPIKAPCCDLDLSIPDGIVSSKGHNKQTSRSQFNKGCISQLNHFARGCSSTNDCIFNAKILKQGY